MDCLKVVLYLRFTYNLHASFKLYKACHLQPPLRLWNMDPVYWLFKKRIQTFETKRKRKLLRISYLEHKTNDCVWSKINFLVGLQEPPLATVDRRKLAWFGHVTRIDSLSRTILLGTLEGGRRRGRQRKRWMDNDKECTPLPMTELLTRAAWKKDWRKISAESSLVPPPPPPAPEDPVGQETGLNWTELTGINTYKAVVYHNISLSLSCCFLSSCTYFKMERKKKERGGEKNTLLCPARLN